MIHSGKQRHAFALVALAIAAVTSSVHATTPAQPSVYDGRYYEVVVADKISWDAAKTAAEARSYKGIQGHLATIESVGEDSFINQLHHASVQDGRQLWVGGFQVPCATTTPEPACGWMWINGDAINPANTASPYTNWQPGEPNNLKRTADALNRATEDHLAIGHNNVSGWNDEGAFGLIRGYVVEYGDKVSVPAAACTGDGCNPTGAQIFQLPSTAKLTSDATLTARTYRFRDNPARCGKQPLILFNGAVVIPPYLCGHPDFFVIETESQGIDVSSGTILVENLTEDVLPGNLYGCSNIRQNPAGAFDPDPTHRDVVAWQSANPGDMPETSLGTGRYFGTLAEVTYGCGSSRGKVLSGSYHFVGLQIAAGEGNEYSVNKPGNLKSLTDVTAYKLDLLKTSVVASPSALPKLTYLALKALVDGAIYFHDRGNYKVALVNIKLFLFAAERAKYKVVPGKNFNGDHLMRGSNLEFMYEKKIIPYANR